MDREIDNKEKSDSFMYIIWGVIIILILGTIYQQIYQRIEFKKYKAPGRLIKVGKDKMHIYGQGKGLPTLLFTCGGGFGFTLGVFYKAFSKLSKKNRVVVYDRFGFGWSDSTKRLRDMQQINEDLYELLDKAKEKGPYVLIGHSLGATEVLQFAQRYPDLVSGVIMLDGVSPSFYKSNQHLYWQNLLLYYTSVFLRLTGILRIVINLTSLFKKSYSKEIEKISNMMIYNKIFTRNAWQEIKGLFNNNDLNNGLADIPLLILSAEKTIKKNQKWLINQENILDLSSNSKKKIIKGVDHMFPIKKPDIVIEEILWFLENMVKKK